MADLPLAVIEADHVAPRNAHAILIFPMELLLARRAGVLPSVLDRVSLWYGGDREREGE